MQDMLSTETVLGTYERELAGFVDCRGEWQSLAPTSSDVAC